MSSLILYNYPHLVIYEYYFILNSITNDDENDNSEEHVTIRNILLMAHLMQII